MGPAGRTRSNSTAIECSCGSRTARRGCTPARVSTGQRNSPRSPKQAAALPDAIIDGEIVALDERRSADFAALQAALSEQQHRTAGLLRIRPAVRRRRDLRRCRCRERKQRLQMLLAPRMPASARIRYVRALRGARRCGAAVGLPHVAGGHRLQAARCALSLRPRRMPGPRQMPRRTRSGHRRLDARRSGALRSLLVGVHRDDQLVYVGRVGTGFGHREVARCCRA